MNGRVNGHGQFNGVNGHRPFNGVNGHRPFNGVNGHIPFYCVNGHRPFIGVSNGFSLNTLRSQYKLLYQKIDLTILLCN